MSFAYRVWTKKNKLISEGAILALEPPDDETVDIWTNMLLERYPNATTILIHAV